MLTVLTTNIFKTAPCIVEEYIAAHEHIFDEHVTGHEHIYEEHMLHAALSVMVTKCGLFASHFASHSYKDLLAKLDFVKLSTLYPLEYIRMYSNMCACDYLCKLHDTQL